MGMKRNFNLAENESNVKRSLLSFVLFLFLSANLLAAKSDCENGVLVVSSNNQKHLDECLASCPTATSVHLKLSPEPQYNFESLQNMKGITHLSIEFPGENELSLRYDFGLNSMNYIDCSFLAHLENLQFLVIDWEGDLEHIEVLTELDNLIYARLPFSAFHPTLFADQSSVVQYEFGDRLTCVFRKDGKADRLELSFFGYEAFLNGSNKRLKTFQKKANRINEGEVKWTKQFSTSSGSDYYSLIVDDARNGVINWTFEMKGSGLTISGSFNENDGTTTRTVDQPFFMNKVTVLADSAISITYIKKKEDGSFDASNVRKVGFKNGKKHGEFYDKRYRDHRMVYDQGVLRYAYGFSDTLPKIETRYAISSRFGSLTRSFKELYFEEDGRLQQINVLSSRKEDPRSSLLATFPWKDGVLNGQLIVFSEAGDTLCSAHYEGGALNGPFLSWSISETDTIRNEGFFDNNKLSGTFVTKNPETTLFQEYRNDTIVHAIYSRNSDDFVLQEMRWLEDEACFETKFWRNDKVLFRILRNNRNGKAISDKKLAEARLEPLPPPPP